MRSVARSVTVRGWSVVVDAEWLDGKTSRSHLSPEFRTCSPHVCSTRQPIFFRMVWNKGFVVRFLFMRLFGLCPRRLRSRSLPVGRGRGRPTLLASVGWVQPANSEIPLGATEGDNEAEARRLAAEAATLVFEPLPAQFARLCSDPRKLGNSITPTPAYFLMAVRPSGLVFLRLMASSNLVVRSTGISSGWSYAERAE